MAAMRLLKTAQRDSQAPSPSLVLDDAPSESVTRPRPAPAPHQWSFDRDFVEQEIVTRDAIEIAQSHAQVNGTTVSEELVAGGFIQSAELAAMLADLRGLPLLCDLHEITPTAEALELLPEALVRRHLVLPVDVSAGTLTVAVAEPSARVLASIRAACGLRIAPFVSTAAEIRRCVDAAYCAFGDIDRFVEAFSSTDVARRALEVEAPEGLAGEAPVVQIANRILAQALRERASDIHLEPQEDKVRVRFRIDGALKDVLELPEILGAPLVSRIKIMAGMNIVERRRPQDGQFSTRVDERDLSVRVATVATINGEKCVMRLLDKSRSLMQLQELGMPPETAEKYSRLVRSPFGMVLCAGPTGSGKTTTLYATLAEVADPTRNVMTIEDPVEYHFPSINQIQTNEQSGLGFATGLKSILRQDPDVILVGEIRDVETARIAVQSALTGHFVLSSVHATDAVSALHRFLDMGVESFLIASSVIAIVAQRLVRRICPSCKAPYTPTPNELAFYQECGGPEKDVFYRGTGCNFCAGTGFRDRIGVYELLPITPEIKRLIAGWATQEEIRRLATRQGLQTLQEGALDLVANDVTTIFEVMRNVYSM